MRWERRYRDLSARLPRLAATARPTLCGLTACVDAYLPLHRAWPGLAADRLLASEFTPMLSPGLADSIGGVRQPADLLRLPIIDATDVCWTQWLAAAGVPAEGFEDRPGSRTRVQLYEGKAAIAGQGVALLAPAFFADELAEGRLIQPFDLVCDDGDAYWLVYPEARRNTPKIAAFRRWVLGEAAPGAGQPA
ncbi:LysR substrate-binding domain-containing protein [Inquilinus sp. CA228]|uniref:LysR substrate-binding domain-containing protein n=1 Tax=Inquilinus sp. CA228 TaxID=3455609 RepID=UPI003F8D208C